MKRGVRWDWIVVMVGAFCCAAVAYVSPWGIGLAIGGAYSLGRWDEGRGERFRS